MEPQGRVAIIPQTKVARRHRQDAYYASPLGFSSFNSDQASTFSP